MLDNLGAGIILCSNELVINYVNAYLSVMVGHDLKQVRNQHLNEFTNYVHPDDHVLFKRSQMLSLIGEPFQYRFRLLHESGLLVWIEARVMPLLDSEGSVVATLTILLDISRTVRVEDELRNAHQEIQDFTYMVSHDLRSPIVTLRGGLRIVGEMISDNEHELLTHLLASCDRLDALVDAVIELSRVSRLEIGPQPVSVMTAIQEALDTHRQRLEQVKATVALEGEFGEVRATPIALWQIFSNLIDNAIKYRRIDTPLHITIRGSSLSSGAAQYRLLGTVSIQDNGRGIPLEKLDAIFRPFQRVHSEAAQGSGVGLACVKKLVEQMDGLIKVESTENNGTTFYVSLPVNFVSSP
jgi:PAS domain S-box-containing protein